MKLPTELKHLVEKFKAQYQIVGSDDEILMKVIPMLEDEDIIKLYDELCEEENKTNFKNGTRPSFEKYREEILNYLDDTIIKAEIIKREQLQSSKADLSQRNYTYIAELTTTLDNKPDKIKIIKNFYRKIKQLENSKNLLNVKETVHNLELSIHIYECIFHISEKMLMDLVLYRGFDGKKTYILKDPISLRKIKRKRKEKENSSYQSLSQILYLNQMVQRINQLKKEVREIKLKENRNDDARE